MDDNLDLTILIGEIQKEAYDKAIDDAALNAKAKIVSVKSSFNEVSMKNDV